MRFNNAVDASRRVEWCLSSLKREGGDATRALCVRLLQHGTLCAHPTDRRSSFAGHHAASARRHAPRSGRTIDRSIDRDGGFAWGRRGCDDDDDEWVVWSYDEFEFEFIECIELVGNAQSASLEGGDGVGGVRGDVCVGKRGVGDG